MPGLGELKPAMPSPLFDLTGRTALVTGATSGIGLSLARGLAAAGARVVVNGRDEARIAATVESLKAEGLAVSGSRFDVTAAAQIEPALARIEADVGPLDILVNNAGIQRRGPLLDMDLATFEEVIRTNLTGVFLVGQAAARLMVPRRRGKIVNIASLASEVARKTIAPYVAAKGAVKQLTRAMCTRMGGRQHPGQRHRPRLFQDAAQRRPVERSGLQFLGQGAHAGRPLGTDGGTRRRGGVPVLLRLGFRQRTGDLCRRRAPCLHVNRRSTRTSISGGRSAATISG